MSPVEFEKGRVALSNLRVKGPYIGPILMCESGLALHCIP